MDEIVKNRTYMNNTVHMFEMHDIESYQQKREKRDYLRSLIKEPK